MAGLFKHYIISMDGGDHTVVGAGDFDSMDNKTFQGNTLYPAFPVEGKIRISRIPGIIHKGGCPDLRK